MGDIDNRYRDLLRQAEKGRLDAFAQEEQQNPTDFNALLDPSAGRPKDPPKKPMSLMDKAVDTAGAGIYTSASTGYDGFAHFAKGLYRAVGGEIQYGKPRTGSFQESLDDANEVVSGMGETLLGGLTILSALPMGVGEAFQTAMKNFTPGLEKSVALPSWAAAPIRMALASPMLLDPKFREYFHDARTSEQVMKKLSEPMTYGEVMNTVASFVAFPLQARAGRKVYNRYVPNLDVDWGKAAKEGIAESIEYPVTLVTEPLTVRSVKAIPGFGETGGIWPMGSGNPAPWVRQQPSSPMTPVDLATRLQVLAEELRGKAKAEKKSPEGAPDEVSAGEGLSGEEASNKKMVEDAGGIYRGTTNLGVWFDEPTSGSTGLMKIGDMNVDNLKKSIADTKSKFQAEQSHVESYTEGFKNDLEKGTTVVEDLLSKIVAELNIEERKLFGKEVSIDKVPGRGKPKAAAEPEVIEPVKEKSPAKTSRWEDDAGAIPGEPIAYLDASTAALDDAVAVITHLDETATKFVVHDRGGKVIGEKKGYDTLAEAKAAAEGKFPTESKGTIDVKPTKGGRKVNKSLKSESGATLPEHLPLLARMALGAAIGGTQGDTPEERIAYAFALAGLGALGPRLAKSIVAALRESAPSVLDPTNPTVPGFSPPPEPAGIKMPSSRGMTVQDILNRDIINEPFNPSEMRQVNHIETQAVQQVFDIAKKIKAGEPHVEGELKQAMGLARSIYTALSDTFQSRGERGIEARVGDAQKELAELARHWDPSTPDTTLANVITNFPRRQQISQFTRLYFAIPEAITQAMYGAILSGEALVKNGIGNTAMLPLQAVDRSLAALKFWDPSRPTLNEGMRGLMTVWDSAIDQYRLIKHAEDWKSVWRVLDEQARDLGSTHVEVNARGFEALSDMGAENSFRMFDKGMQYLANAANAGPGVLSRTDGMAKFFQRRMAIQWEAMEVAGKTEALGGAEYWSRVQELTENYNRLPADALKRISDSVERGTFTKRLEGAILSSFQEGPKDPVLNMLYRMTIGTFVRTPLRILEVGFDYTPGLNFISSNFRSAMRAGGTEAAVAEARLATGLVTIGAFTYLAAQGNITGTPPSDPKEVRMMEAAGRPAYSFWDPLSEKWRSYRGMEPMTTLIATGANLANAIAKMSSSETGGDKIEKLIVAAALAEWHGIDSNIYLQSVSEVLDVLKNGRDDVQFGKSLEYIRRRLSQFNPAVLRELEQAVDPTRSRPMAGRAIDPAKNVWALARQEFNMLMQEYVRAIPGADTDMKRDRNLFTGDFILDDVWPYNPFRARPDQPAPWAAEIQRLQQKGISLGIDRLPEWMGKHREYDTGMSQQPELPGVRLTGPELDRWEVLMTQQAKDGMGRNLVGAMNDLVQGDLFKRQSDPTKADMLHRLWVSFKERGQAMLLRENDELRRAVTEQKRRSIDERLPLDSPMRRQPRRLEVNP